MDVNKKYPNPLRAWQFTVFNYTAEDEDRVRALTESCHRLVCGREVCPKTGTPHLQGYARFKSSHRASWVQKAIKDGCHVEPLRSTETALATYSAKDGDLVVDHGVNDDEAASRKRTRDEEAEEVISEIEKGEPFGRIRNRHKRFVFWYRRQVLDYLRDERALAVPSVPSDIKADLPADV